jgi:glycolate oxidase
MEMVMADGEVVTLGGPAPDPPGYDLRGVVVGSEGMMGVVTRICVRLTPEPPAIRTMLLDFPTISDAAAVVEQVIAAGVIPASLEMMDRNMLRTIEPFVHADLPVDAAAALLVEVDGTPADVEAGTDAVQRVAAANNVGHVRVAKDEDERALLWKARKSAFGACARVKPNYFLHDCVVPRSRLVEVMQAIIEITDREDLICLNVFHAGDGNLHPIIAFDRRDADEVERVKRAGDAIIRTCVEVGGTLSGEHGIGLHKMDFLVSEIGEDAVDLMRHIKSALDPLNIMNPGKIFAD